MGRKQKLREEKRKIKKKPPLSVAATATVSKTVPPAPAAIIVPPSSDDHQFPKSSTNEQTESIVITNVGAGLLRVTVTDLDLANDSHNAFPNSYFQKVGAGLLKLNLFDSALDAFKRGAAETGCVPCMLEYAMLHIHKQGNMIHLRFPWLLEGAIRGHTDCMSLLNNTCYNLDDTEYNEEFKHINAVALGHYWARILISMNPDMHLTTIEMRKNLKKEIGTVCLICARTDLDDDVTLVACGKCGYYYYCGKECQLKHWYELNHLGECRQLQILNEYHKPYAKRIRKAIICGDDPKHIPELQTLRTKLGLNRPKEDYKELVELLNTDDDDDGSNRPNRYEYLVATRKGTVHIGSTPESI
ncbi:hypothetical protein FRACYDRAFT_244078 [Fragilariopsis cylindrus CCMP1102]|uniref:MYND-type domain-containing protein n=1 Tax=Fragilariopsis cylindrus CCMP1102 TaxID=635003 RepID=A0A1E7F4L5_9STRA|nr:hypothetical protein FRACYDRAFT_244078 [Fragilariopsis cylindrus CCMP1102]|eukprot:OEU12803.1 hypothetical protein FRACYDRAFT_244078 [Fragilariopsis cylindrus CCMP1102]